MIVINSDKIMVMKKSLLSFLFLVFCLVAYSQVTSSDVILHYAFENNLNDETSNNHDGTAVKTINYDASGKIGSCLSLSKTDVGGGESPSGLLDTSTDPFTVTTWVKIDDLSSPCTFFVIYQNGGTATRADGWAIVHNNTSRIRYNFGTVVKDDLSTVISTGLAGWNHIATVVDPVGGTITTYVDGAFDYTVSASIGQFLGKVSVGYNAENEVRTHDGLLDEFALFNRALTAEEVADVYANGVPSIPNSIGSEISDNRISITKISDNINIITPENLINSVVSIEVYDVSGSLVYSNNIPATPTIVLKGIKAKGVLIVKVNDYVGKVIL
ncbi:LamG domain-containing protein [Labilibacter sediminis]|nr:LamG domain-containing protein [Labilibacter sediminis]